MRKMLTSKQHIAKLLTTRVSVDTNKIAKTAKIPAHSASRRISEMINLNGLPIQRVKESTKTIYSVKTKDESKFVKMCQKLGYLS